MSNSCLLIHGKYPFHCIIDPDGKVTAQYEVTAIPTKIFIDKKGKIRYKSTGADLATMLEEIDTVINLIK